MKRFYLLILCAALGIALASCSKNEPITFDGAFIHLTDEGGNNTSTIDWESNKYLAIYYVYLVTSSSSDDITVEYEIKAGDGLTEGEDYKHISSTASPILFPSGIYKMPIRIEWNKKQLDPTKNNTLQIILTSCSNPKVLIGRPGPSKLGSTHIITKK